MYSRSRRADIECGKYIYGINIGLGQLGQSDFCIYLTSGQSDPRHWREWKSHEDNRQQNCRGRDASSDVPAGSSTPVSAMSTFPGPSEGFETIFVLLNSLL